MDSDKSEYTWMKLRNQVLHRPDTYVGSIQERKSFMWVKRLDVEHFQHSHVIENPGLIRIFVEIASNALDNVWRSNEAKVKCTCIKFDIDRKDNMITVWNDGSTIPIQMHEPNKEAGEPEENRVWNPALIFGVLLTSNNYDDSKVRKTSGRNGLGAKLCNLLSVFFKVEIFDHKRSKHYVQVWRDNMSVLDPVDIKVKKGTASWTKISFIPDFKRFGMEKFSEDILSIYTKYMYNCAMLSKIPVYINDERLPIDSFKSFALLHYPEEQYEVMLFNSKDTKVVLIPSNEYRFVSFVNGMETSRGGVHVNAWIEAIFRPIVAAINKKSEKKKRPKINIGDVKKCFTVFVDSSVSQPTFESQSKHELIGPKIVATVKSSSINKLLKWRFADIIEQAIKTKELMMFQKREKKGSRKKKAAGLDDANNAGKSQSGKCLLLLTEGDSAKTFAISGMDAGVPFNGGLAVGRDYLGFLPLRGKVLNVMNASNIQIINNKVIYSIISALGLEMGVDYTDDRNFRKVRYGGVGILTDADVDGNHIKALVMLFFLTLFPTLLKRKTPFIVGMLTPIARIFFSNGEQSIFYDEDIFKEFVKSNMNKRKFTVQYYKGLGSSEDGEILDIFGKRMVNYFTDDRTQETFSKAFNKTMSDQRKKWLSDYNSGDVLIMGDMEDAKESIVSQSFADFIDEELIKFSMNDCERSIASMIDGNKESNRKILYAMIMKNLKGNKKMKVAQLAGYVAENTEYHHGEQCLVDTITKMAMEFPGSNNIPLFFRGSQMGSRLLGGKDAAAPRYSFTRLEDLTRKIFPPVDDCLLERVISDGKIVEPKFYAPIIPMVLVNGTKGIGTGYSSDIPCFNPLDLVKCVKAWLEIEGDAIIRDGCMVISEIPVIHPWYRGFKGEIEKVANNKYITRGIIERTSESTLSVTELPVKMWTDDFRDFLADIKSDKKIINYKNYSNVIDVRFDIKEDINGLRCDHKNMKLTSYLYTSNMVLYTADGKLKKYQSIDDIIDEFCKVRYGVYTKRKQKLIDDVSDKINENSNKLRFLTAIIDGELDVMRRSRADVVKELKDKKYDVRMSKKDKLKEIYEGGEAIEGDEKKGGYAYLLNTSIVGLTKERLEKLNKEILNLQSKLAEFRLLEEKAMWIKDLDVFTVSYKKWLKVMESREKSRSKSKKK